MLVDAGGPEPAAPVFVDDFPDILPPPPPLPDGPNALTGQDRPGWNGSASSIAGLAAAKCLATRLRLRHRGREHATPSVTRDCVPGSDGGSRGRRAPTPKVHSTATIRYFLLILVLLLCDSSANLLEATLAVRPAVRTRRVGQEHREIRASLACPFPDTDLWAVAVRLVVSPAASGKKRPSDKALGRRAGREDAELRRGGDADDAAPSLPSRGVCVDNFCGE
jgi:hypothetical protein